MYSIIRKLFKLKNEFLRKILFDKNTLKLFSYKYTSYYIKKDNDDLTKLCKKYITNKGYELSQIDNNKFNLYNYQNYSDYYSEIFALNKNNIKNLLELGIGSIDKNNLYNMNMLGKKYKPGASLRVWRDYFKKARIYGADIDKKSLFTEKRIKTTYVNQSKKKTILNMFKTFGVNKFDIIIDDGCHRYEETKKFFEIAINKLKEDGIYIIEDIVPSQRKKYLNYFKKYNFKVKIINFHRPTNNIISNCIITIRK
jgi:hypothetical protein